MTDEQPKNPTPPAAAPTIGALWFDAQGCGPTAWSIRVQPFDTELDRETDMAQQLGIRVHGPREGINKALLAVSPTHRALLDGGFLLGRDSVEALHRQLGAWLAAHPAEASR
jgi:hypothetical protein